MSKSIHRLIDEQIKRWETDSKEEVPIQEKAQVITISRESGSQGFEVAKALCNEIGFDLFDYEIVNLMVETSKNSRVLLETLDERGMNVVEDVVSNFVNKHHLWEDEYSKLLFKILTTIGKHGKAVILGRGANCVLQHLNIFRVRLVAPLAIRRQNIQNRLDLNKEYAQKHIVSTDANRAAFVKKYFNSDTTDSSNYDLVINTGALSVEKTVQIIKCAIT